MKSNIIFSLLIISMYFISCQRESLEFEDPYLSLHLNKGNNQSGIVNSSLESSVEISVSDFNGDPVENAKIKILVEGEYGKVVQDNILTDNKGKYSFDWELGYVEGLQSIEVVIDTNIHVKNEPLIISATAEAKQFTCGDIFVDPRDGKEYQTIKINGDCWMKEFLNYEGSSSICYGGKKENCDKYGRLYQYEIATNVCPQGFHLPTDKEWQDLLTFAGDPIGLLEGGHNDFNLQLGGARFTTNIQWRNENSDYINQPPGYYGKDEYVGIWSKGLQGSHVKKLVSIGSNLDPFKSVSTRSRNNYYYIICKKN